MFACAQNCGDAPRLQNHGSWGNGPWSDPSNFWSGGHSWAVQPWSRGSWSSGSERAWSRPAIANGGASPAWSPRSANANGEATPSPNSARERIECESEPTPAPEEEDFDFDEDEKNISEALKTREDTNKAEKRAAKEAEKEAKAAAAAAKEASGASDAEPTCKKRPAASVDVASEATTAGPMKRPAAAAAEAKAKAKGKVKKGAAEAAAKVAAALPKAAAKAKAKATAKGKAVAKAKAWAYPVRPIWGEAGDATSSRNAFGSKWYGRAKRAAFVTKFANAKAKKAAMEEGSKACFQAASIRWAKHRL